ncbi:hypothetical protein L208DRAFT_1488914, partial [Tricholoma matsutake]
VYCGIHSLCTFLKPSHRTADVRHWTDTWCLCAPGLWCDWSLHRFPSGTTTRLNTCSLSCPIPVYNMDGSPNEAGAI